MTRAETLLWRQLKAHRVAGLSFRRQAPMGHYIVDFVSHAAKLVIEIDGESHGFQEQIAYDARRSGWFASRGYRVLRFSNDDVMSNLEGVVLFILEIVACGSPPSLTLPRKGGGDRQQSGATPCP